MVHWVNPIMGSVEVRGAVFALEFLEDSASWVPVKVVRDIEDLFVDYS